MGIPAEHISLHAHQFQYGTKHDSAVVRFARYCVKKRISLIHNKNICKFFWLVMTVLSRVSLFIWCLVKFDVFILGGGSSFFQFLEFPILRCMGKKIIYTLHGTDVRPPYVDGIREDMTSQEQLKNTTEEKTLIHRNDQRGNNNKSDDEYYYVRTAKNRKRAACRIGKYADVVIAYPSFAHFLSKPFVQWPIIGLPLQIDIQQTQPEKEIKAESLEAVKILHCPSHLIAKGTYEIRKAIDSLGKKGHKIEYLELTGRPNHEVLQEVRQCDFIIDQVYSDVPMAAFATEAAFLGKPAVVGGYYSSLIRQDLGEKWIAPSLFCHPAELEKAIEKLIVDKEFRVKLGQQAREFVEKNSTAKNVAKQYLRLIKNDIPKDWIFDPNWIHYVQGMGIEEGKARAIVRMIIEKYGKHALFLSDKSELERQFVEFAYSKDSSISFDDE